MLQLGENLATPPRHSNWPFNQPLYRKGPSNRITNEWKSFSFRLKASLETQRQIVGRTGKWVNNLTLGLWGWSEVGGCLSNASYSSWKLTGISFRLYNPFTPESDQLKLFSCSLTRTITWRRWRSWLFMAYSDERWLYYQFSLPHFIYISAFLVWEWKD